MNNLPTSEFKNETSIFYYADITQKIPEKEFEKEQKYQWLREMWTIIHSIGAFQFKKYGIYDGYIKNPENQNLPDIIIQKGSNEIPNGHFEITNICKYNKFEGGFEKLIKEDFFEIVLKAIEKKSKKGYRIPSGISGLILDCGYSTVKFPKSSILKMFHENNNKLGFDIIILLGFLSKYRTITYIYNKQTKKSYVFEVESNGKDKIVIENYLEIKHETIY